MTQFAPSRPAVAPYVAFPMGVAACGTGLNAGGVSVSVRAYQYAWARAKALAAEQAWTRFDPSWN